MKGRGFFPITKKVVIESGDLIYIGLKYIVHSCGIGLIKSKAFLY